MDSEVLQNLVEVNLESSNGHVQIIQHSIIIVDLELLEMLLEIVIGIIQQLHEVPDEVLDLGLNQTT